MINVEEIAEIAVKYKHEGNNCAQSVLLALKELTNLKEDELLKLGSGFGVGFGSMEATCGALIAANMILGLTGDGKPKKMFESRDMLHDFYNFYYYNQLFHDFYNLSGATICRDLKGVDTGKVLCSCDDCVRNAVKVLLKRI